MCPFSSTIAKWFWQKRSFLTCVVSSLRSSSRLALRRASGSITNLAAVSCHFGQSNSSMQWLRYRLLMKRLVSALHEYHKRDWPSVPHFPNSKPSASKTGRNSRTASICSLDRGLCDSMDFRSDDCLVRIRCLSDYMITSRHSRVLLLYSSGEQTAISSALPVVGTISTTSIGILGQGAARTLHSGSRRRYCPVVRRAAESPRMLTVTSLGLVAQNTTTLRDRATHHWTSDGALEVPQVLQPLADHLFFAGGVVCGTDRVDVA